MRGIRVIAAYVFAAAGFVVGLVLSAPIEWLLDHITFIIPWEAVRHTIAGCAGISIAINASLYLFTAIHPEKEITTFEHASWVILLVVYMFLATVINVRSGNKLFLWQAGYATVRLLPFTIETVLSAIDDSR